MQRERVAAVAVVDHPEAHQDRRQPVAHDPVGAGAVADRVVVERARVGDQEREHPRERHAAEDQRRRA